MAPIQLVLLLSVGSFQATIPGQSKDVSPAFEDSPEGLKSFTAWATSRLGEPKFNQPPLQMCVVGAVPFTGKAPYVAQPIWGSQPPVRALEPYAATFHYVDIPKSSQATKPRTMKDAVELCGKSAAK